jgi:hypothetical protein
MMHESELLLAIGRLEGKMDALIQMQRTQEEQIKLHDERLRELEHSKSFLMGFAALAGAASSFLFSTLNKMFGAN